MCSIPLLCEPAFPVGIVIGFFLGVVMAIVCSSSSNDQDSD